MTYSVSMKDVSHYYGRKKALDGVTAEIPAGTITGLLGRNGSGKSTLAMLLAGQMKAQGTLLVDGESPWESPDRMTNTTLVSDSTSIFLDAKLSRTADLWSISRPNWSAELYTELLDLWGLHPNNTYSALSRGQKSAFVAAIGLASRSALTIFDEVHLGMDVVVRQEFYDVMLSEFIDHPRTIILSSHLVSEIENLVEDVMILDRGALLASGTADELRAAHGTDTKQASLTDVLVNLTGRGRTK